MYVDEVGNSDIGSSGNENHRHLSLTGIIVDLEYVSKYFQPSLEDLKVKYFGSHPDEPIIMHRKELVRKKPPFSILNKPEIEIEFNKELIRLLSVWDFTILTVLIDKKEFNEKYSGSWKYDPYHYCQEILIERYKLLLELKGSVGDVMFESRGGKEDMRLKKSFRRLMDEGTNYVSHIELAKYFTSKELKIKPKASNIAGLQISDLLAHPMRRWVFKNLLENDDGKVTFADAIIEAIQPKIFSYKGKVNGYGVKKLP